MNERLPVLVVHGLWDSAARIAPLVDGLRARGLPIVEAVDLVPSDGRVSIATLAEIVARAIDDLGARNQAGEIDVVGFSMGALTTRACLQLHGERLKTKVRRFVSISGPHAGSNNAFGLPAKTFPGVADMRPGSAFLRSLAEHATDGAHLPGVEVHCLYTPFDAMVWPAKSAVLAEAKTVRSFPIVMHRLMIRDARVMDAVVEILRA